MLNVPVDVDLFSLGEPGGPVSLQTPATPKKRCAAASPAPKAAPASRRKAPAKKPAPVPSLLRQDGPSGPMGGGFDGPSGPMGGGGFDGPSGPMGGNGFDGPSGPMLF